MANESSNVTLAMEFGSYKSLHNILLDNTDEEILITANYQTKRMYNPKARFKTGEADFHYLL